MLANIIDKFVQNGAILCSDLLISLLLIIHLNILISAAIALVCERQHVVRVTALCDILDGRHCKRKAFLLLLMEQMSLKDISDIFVSFVADVDLNLRVEEKVS